VGLVHGDIDLHGGGREGVAYDMGGKVPPLAHSSMVVGAVNGRDGPRQ
jgi:hypothetical protein